MSLPEREPPSVEEWCSYDQCPVGECSHSSLHEGRAAMSDVPMRLCIPHSSIEPGTKREREREERPWSRSERQ